MSDINVPVNEEEAAKMISNLTNEAYEKIRAAEAIAEKFEIAFDFSVTYGMGGYFDGRDGEWQPSSHGC